MRCPDCGDARDKDDHSDDGDGDDDGSGDSGDRRGDDTVMMTSGTVMMEMKMMMMITE